jgi:hypothetical protein
MIPVRSLNLILMLLGALSVLILGALPASAKTGDAAAPCHEAAATSPSHHEAPVPSGKPEKGMVTMACCVSCVVAPALQSPASELAAHPEAPAVPVPASLPVGLSPTPEHGPPKV